MTNEINNIEPSGSTNFGAGFTTAFNLLTTSKA